MPKRWDMFLLLAMQVISLGLLSMTMWGQTVAHVPLHISSPFAYLLAMPHGRSLSAFGGVALFPWLLLCDKASNALARALFPPRAPLVQSRAVGASSMQHGDSDANIQDVKDE